MSPQAGPERPFDPSRRASVLTALGGVLEREPGILWAYAFGSLARGEAFRDVDVAIAVEAGTHPTLRSLGRLSRILASATGLEGVGVDVFDVRRCPLPMIDEVLRDGVVLADRTPAERRLWEAEVTVRWIDFQPFWEAQRSARARR